MTSPPRHNQGRVSQIGPSFLPALTDFLLNPAMSYDIPRPWSSTVPAFV